MMERINLRPGQLAMYVAYGGKDEFNADAQVENFLYAARQRGVHVGVGYDPKGRHNLKTGIELFPGGVEWLAPLIAPFSPPLDMLRPARMAAP